MKPNFVLCWSFSQRAFDVDSFENVLSKNFETFRRHCGADYIPLEVFESREQASAAREKYEKWLPDRKEHDERA